LRDQLDGPEDCAGDAEDVGGDEGVVHGDEALLRDSIRTIIIAYGVYQSCLPGRHTVVVSNTTDGTA
jgi:hypothetical protein